MERNEVSRHEIAVLKALLEADTWLTNAEIADRAQVAGRTARAHTLKLVKLNVIDQAEVFPAHRYRISAHAMKRNRGYFDRLHRAAEVLGVDLNVTL